MKTHKPHARNSYYLFILIALLVIVANTLAFSLMLKQAYGAETPSSMQVETRVVGDPNSKNVEKLRSYFFKQGSHYVDAARGRYSPNGSMVLFDAKHDGKFFDVFEFNRITGAITSITDGNKRFPRHAGNAVYDPSGRWIVFIAEEPNHNLATNPQFTGLGQPGIGLYNNLWSYDRVTKKYYKLTNIPIKTSVFDPTPSYATVNPKISADGLRIMWTELYANGPFAGHWGKWRVKIADFRGHVLKNKQVVLDSQITCKLRKLYNPTLCEDASLFGNYVTGMGFHPLDRNVLLLAGNLDGQHVYGMDLYIYKLLGKFLFNVTRDADDWTEGSTWTTNGQGIITMSFRLFTSPPMDTSDLNWVAQETWREYWLLSSDGKARSRLTYLRCPGCNDRKVLPWSGNMAIVGAVARARHDPALFLGLVGNIDDDDRRVLGLLEFRLKGAQ